MKRAVRSVAPPAAIATRIRIGRSASCCALDRAGIKRTKAAHNMRTAERGFNRVVRSTCTSLAEPPRDALCAGAPHTLRSGARQGQVAHWSEQDRQAEAYGEDNVANGWT